MSEHSLLDAIRIRQELILQVEKEVINVLRTLSGTSEFENQKPQTQRQKLSWALGSEDDEETIAILQTSLRNYQQA